MIVVINISKFEKLQGNIFIEFLFSEKIHDET